MCVFWYNLYVNPKPLSPDLAKALHAAGDEPLPVIDPSSQNVYFVVDEQTHRKAMAALLGSAKISRMISSATKSD
jgi:hypothetical protein